MADFDSDDAVFDESFFDEEDEEQDQGRNTRVAKLGRDIKTKSVVDENRELERVIGKCAEFATELGDTTAESAAATTAPAPPAG